MANSPRPRRPQGKLTTEVQDQVVRTYMDELKANYNFLDRIPALERQLEDHKASSAYSQILRRKPLRTVSRPG